MADDETTISANTEAVETVDDSQEPQVFTKEEYQNLQRKLSAKDVSEKMLKRQLAELNSNTRGSDQRYEQSLEAIVEALKDNSMGIDTDRLSRVVDNTKASRANTEYVSKALGELQDIIGDDNFNTEEKYQKARGLWQGCRITEALAESRQVNSPDTQIDTVELARKIRSDIMKELGRVDTGDSTTSTSTKGSSAEALGKIDTSRMTVNQLTEHKNALYGAMNKENGIEYRR